jgi:hypothetical protein
LPFGSYPGGVWENAVCRSVLAGGSIGGGWQRIVSASAFEWAVQASEERRVPPPDEIMCEREANAAMGLSVDKINEYEPILDRTREAAGQVGRSRVVGGIPERD